MAGDEGRVGAASPVAAQRSRSASRIAIDVGQDRGLGVLGQVEALGGAVPGQLADREAEGFVGCGEDRGGGRGLGGEGATHPHGLGTLAGAHEGKLTHACSVGRLGSTERNYRAGLHTLHAQA